MAKRARKLTHGYLLAADPDTMEGVLLRPDLTEAGRWPLETKMEVVEGRIEDDLRAIELAKDYEEVKA
jgi:hypothetical protein